VIGLAVVFAAADSLNRRGRPPGDAPPGTELAPHDEEPSLVR
jgi:hypothetical protein